MNGDLVVKKIPLTFYEIVICIETIDEIWLYGLFQALELVWDESTVAGLRESRNK